MFLYAVCHTASVTHGHVGGTATAFDAASALHGHDGGHDERHDGWNDGGPGGYASMHRLVDVYLRYFSFYACCISVSVCECV